MTDTEVRQIQFKMLLSWVITDHVRHQKLRQKIQHALYYLRSKGVVRKVGKDRWEAVR